MLKQLYIRNFTLIDTLDMRFHPGFSVITGETGAGKSIILGAINLLLGQRADTKAIKSGSDRCVIEAHFDLSKYKMKDFFDCNDIDYDADDCIIRREITTAGKSRAFINDTPVSLATMKQLGQQLVDIHSQHQNLLLNEEDFQLSVIDIIARNNGLMEKYRNSYTRYTEAHKAVEQLKAAIEKSRDNEDFLRFQCNELEEAQLEPELQEQLEQESETLSHVEDIKEALFLADEILSGGDGNGAVERVRDAARLIANIKEVYPEAEDAAGRLESCYIELKDISREINAHAESIDFDPQRLDVVNARLDVIYSLQKKHHVTTINELIDIRDGIREQLTHIDNSDEELQLLTEKEAEALKQCERHANELTTARRKAADGIEKDMSRRLVALGMPKVRFAVSIEQKPLGISGHDKVSFLFSANTSTPMQPVAQVASGGEIARVMLSLKAMISGAVKLPTIIFDEIDTGVSGKIAEKMAMIMHEMGNSERQVISITHLPQIAARGTTHYKVYKEETPQGTTSSMKMLTNEERVNEIAQMLSGSDITDAAIKNACELLGNMA